MAVYQTGTMGLTPPHQTTRMRWRTAGVDDPFPPGHAGPAPSGVEATVEGVGEALGRSQGGFGQRTTLDVRNAQREPPKSRVTLIVTQRDRAIFSYGVVQAIGQLTARFTALPVEVDSARAHHD